MFMLSILFFAVITFSLGYATTYWVKEPQDFLERLLTRLGLGLASFIVLGLLMNVLRVPLDWRLFLVISLLLGLTRAYLDYRSGSILHKGKLTVSGSGMLVLVLFAITLFMHISGAFAYPYLDDDDSWGHAISAKYIAVEKTAFADRSLFQYVDPYPPSYALLMGVLNQTNDSMYWTLKFFNALLVSLPIIFFFYFAKSMTGSHRKALYAAFALFAVPAFLSHFIWAISLTMALFFVAFYLMEKIKDDQRWWFPAALAIAPAITSSPTHSTYFGLMFVIYIAVRLGIQRRILRWEILAGAAGLALSILMWWGPMFIKYGILGTVESFVGRNRGILNIAGTADRGYGISDFLCGPATSCWQGGNMINNPIGIGVLLSILTLLGFLLFILGSKRSFRERRYALAVSGVWFLFAFYAVNAANMPVKISPFRAWMLLAIPVALLSGEAIHFLSTMTRSASSSLLGSSKKAASLISMAIVLVLLLGVFYTSFIPKYGVNTAQWGPGAFWTSTQEIQAFLWVHQELPAGSRLMSFANAGPVIGMDMYMCDWCQEERSYREDWINSTAREIHGWLSQRGYEYVILEGQAFRKYGTNVTAQKAQAMVDSGLFRPIFQNQGAVIFRI